MRSGGRRVRPRATAPTDERWCVALSGGADSLALTAAAARVRPTTALIVDHGLQPDSAAVADDRPRSGARAGMR